LVSGLFACLLVVGVGWFVLRETGSDVGDVSQDDSNPPTVPTPDAAADAPPASPDASPPGDEVTADAASKPTDPPEKTPDAALSPGAIRVEGTVTDATDEPLAAVAVRWIPVAEIALRGVRHDRRVLGAEVDATLVRDGALRAALSRSVLATTDEKGRYALDAVDTHPRGVVVATLSGYRIDIASLDPTSAARAPVATEEPDVPKAESPASAEPAVEGPRTVDFRLESAGEIAGTVKERDTGDPAEGMLVHANPVDPDRPAFVSMMTANAPRAVVGRDGTYAISGLEPGDYSVLARTASSDYASVPSSQGKKVALEPGTTVTGVDFSVDRGGVIAGLVTTSDGDPIADARCQVLPADYMSQAMSGNIDAFVATRSVTTDADGRFEQRGLPCGKKYVVNVRCPSFAPATSDEVALPVDPPRAEVEIALAAGLSIAGRVVREDGSPAASVAVWLVPAGKNLIARAGAAASSRVETDVDGGFVLADLPAGEHQVSVDRFDPTKIVTGGIQSTPVVLTDTDIEDLVLTIRAAGQTKIVGVVVDDLGQPIAGAAVKVAGVQDIAGLSAATVSTSDSGEFVAAELEGQAFRVQASKDGYSETTLANVTADMAEVRLTLARNGRISGRLVDAAGADLATAGRVIPKPVDSASLQAWVQSLMRLGQGKKPGVEIAADGTFDIEVPAGKIELHARVPGLAPSASEVIEVAPGAEYANIEIRVVAGAIVHGRVVSTAGDPVEGATVIALAKSKDQLTEMVQKMMPQFFGGAMMRGVTDEKGEYEVPHLAANAYTVTATHPKFAPSAELEIKLSEDDVRELSPLVLRDGGALVVRVLESGEPKVGCMLQVMSGGGFFRQAATSADGTCRIEPLVASDFQVNIIDTSTGRMRLKTRGVTIESGATTELEVVFGVGVKIRGKVEGLPPTPQRLVMLRRPGGPAPEELDPTDMSANIGAQKFQAGIAFIGPDDTYVLEDLEPGEYVLEIPKMPADPTDLEAYKSMDRTPHFRKKIEVRDKDVELDIRIPKS